MGEEEGRGGEEDGWMKEYRKRLRERRRRR